jgi:hypothetical protein
MRASLKLTGIFALITSFFGSMDPAHAARFANQFAEFELPAQWQCSLEGAEWVCQNTQESKKRDAIIILAAKLKGDQDSLDQYQNYLKGPKSYTSVQGKPVTSEVKYAKTVDLNGQPWVDSLHLDSELPGFYTRYLATIKLDIGVLVTYSIQKDKYQDYLQDLENMARTLKVFRKAGGINAGPQGNLFDVKAPQQLAESTVFPAVAPQGGTESPTAPAKKDDSMIWIIGGVAAVALLLILRRRGG